MKLWKLCLWLTLAAAGPALAAEEIRSLPEIGGDGLFTDVTADGRILRIDYVAKTARVLGTVDVGPEILWRAWIGGEGDTGLFLLLDEAGIPGVHGRIYSYSQSARQLDKSSLVLNVDGDYGVLPVSERLAYVQFSGLGDTSSAVRVAYDPSSNAFLGTFGFPVSQHTIHAFTAKGELLVADPYDVAARIRVIDTRSNMVLRQHEAGVSVGVGPDERVFVTALGGRHALVLKLRSRDSARLYLLDTESWSVVGQSEELEFFTGRFSLGGPLQSRVFCVEEGIRNGRRAPVGTIREFELTGKRLVPVRSVSFNPETEIALRVGDDEFAVFPRYTFNYLSAKALGLKMFDRLWKRHRSSELLEAAREEILAEREAGGRGESEIELRIIP